MQEIANTIDFVNNNLIVPSYIMDKYDDTLIIFTACNKFNITQPNIKAFEIKEKRINQNEFRKQIIERDKHCIITNSNSAMCDACHIIPFSECNDNDQYNINNGFLLNSGLHKLFDKYLWSINPYTQTIKVHNDILHDESYTQINIYHNKVISYNNEIFPFLLKHYETFLITNI